MTTTPNDGGPAFSTITETEHGDRIFPDASGMSLRDYFAGQAMTGIFATNPRGKGESFMAYTNRIAAFAYEQADAMLAARNQEPTQ